VFPRKPIPWCGIKVLINESVNLIQCFWVCSPNTWGSLVLWDGSEMSPKAWFPVCGTSGKNWDHWKVLYHWVCVFKGDYGTLIPSFLFPHYEVSISALWLCLHDYMIPHLKPNSNGTNQLWTKISKTVSQNKTVFFINWLSWLFFTVIKANTPGYNQETY
jgi:hypothetical protein